MESCIMVGCSFLMEDAQRARALQCPGNSDNSIEPTSPVPTLDCNSRISKPNTLIFSNDCIFESLNLETYNLNF